MKTKPAIGLRVTAKWRDLRLTGTVRRLWPSLRENGTESPFSPERWSASVEVDDLPEGWPYRINRFAPLIANIEPIA